MITPSRTLLIAVIVTCTGSGCADTNRVELMTVLAHGNCQTTLSGVRLIDYAKVAELRGAHLLELSNGEDGSAKPLYLIEIVPGEYPTTGYNLSLASRWAPLDNPLIVKVKLTSPPPDAVLAQVITHPCLVVGIDDPAVQRVRVVDDSAVVLGEVTLTAP